MFLCCLCQCVCSFGVTSVCVKGNPAAADTLELVQKPQELVRFLLLHVLLGLKIKPKNSSRVLGTDSQGLLCFPCCMESHTNDSPPPTRVFRIFLPPDVIPDSQSFGSSYSGDLLDFLPIFRTNTNIFISNLRIFCTFSSYLSTSPIGRTKLDLSASGLIYFLSTSSVSMFASGKCKIVSIFNTGKY